MPYLHYETDEGRQKMTDSIKLIGAADEASSSNASPNTLLLQAYLPGKTRIHPRRTLDQFFYHGLDTSARDRDQVVYRYCKNHGELLHNSIEPQCHNTQHLKILAMFLQDFTFLPPSL